MDHEARTALLNNLDEKLDLQYEQAHTRSWLHTVAQPTIPDWHTLSLNPRSIPRSLASISKRFLYALVPQLIRTTVFSQPLPTPKQTSTTWMNGIRGLAALFVFNFHYFYNFTYTIVLGYASDINNWTSNWYLHQLPGISIMFDGPTAVMIFFTVAGYVCAYKPLRAMTNGEHDTLFKTLPASIFRRWFRLYLPTFCVTFGISMLAYFGAYKPTQHLFDPAVMKKNFPGPGDELQPKRFPTLIDQLTNWWLEMIKLYNFWVEYPVDTPFDNHLWTIPYEFRTSMHLYIVLVALALCKPWARLLLLTIICYLYALPLVHHEVTSFFFGAIIAQLDILRQTQQERFNTSTTPTSTPPPRRLLTITRTISYSLSLYLMSFPVRGIKYPSPLYQHTINPLIPTRYGKGVGARIPKQIGAIILMYLLSTVPIHRRHRSLWHRLLTAPIPTYLGTIMFGLYLTHGTVLHLFGYAIPHLVWNHTGGNETLPRYVFGVLVGWTVSVVVALWVADVWTREVEGRCIRVTHWLEGLLFEKR